MLLAKKHLIPGAAAFVKYQHKADTVFYLLPNAQRILRFLVGKIHVDKIPCCVRQLRAIFFDEVILEFDVGIAQFIPISVAKYITKAGHQRECVFSII